MSKMNKTQVTHLKERLNAALNCHVAEKFPPVKQPKVNYTENLKKDKSVADKFLKILEIDAGKYHNSRSYLITLAAHIRTMDNQSVDKGWKDEDRDKYLAKHNKAINDILDVAILGDSADALKALKEFQGNL